MTRKISGSLQVTGFHEGRHRFRRNVADIRVAGIDAGSLGCVQIDAGNAW